MAEDIKYTPGIYWEDDTGKLYMVKADLTQELTDDRTAEATEHPIENGSVISDHVIHKPDTLTLNLLHTNTPIYEDSDFTFKRVPLNVRKSVFQPGGLLLLSRAVGSAVAAIGSLFGIGEEPAVEVFVLTSATPKDRITELHTQLIDAKQKARTVGVSFLGRLWENMIITSVQYTRTNKDQAGRFTVSFKQIRTVKTGTATLPNPQDLIMKPPKNTGAKPGEELAKAEEKNAEKKTWLKMATDAAGITTPGSGL